MSILRSLAGLVVLTALVASCQKTTVSPDDVLMGQWNVTKVEGTQINNGVSGLTLSDTVPSGYIRFDNNGWGEQNYSFKLFSITYPFKDAFKWTSNGTEIRIDLFGQPDMVWTRKVNEPDKQVASYNIVLSATQSIAYTLTLEK